MPGTFSYTESTNTAVVINGTSGSPADFASFVTADRAGVDTDLLVAGSPASNLALTYAVRPVEDLAILVKCIVANKTAEADFIFITGKDWRGAAQTEAIDVTAGNGSYTSTKYWSEITTLDCSDNAAGGGTVWADGDLSVTQDIWGVIWDYGNGQYRVAAFFTIGNGSTSTYFGDNTKQVFLHDITTGSSQTLIRVRNLATFRLGILEDETTKTTSRGVQIISNQSGWGTVIIRSNEGGLCYLYSLNISNIGAHQYQILTLTGGNSARVWNCVLSYRVGIGLSQANFYNLLLQKFTASYGFWRSGGTIEKVILTDNQQSIFTYYTDLVTLKNYESYRTVGDSVVLNGLIVNHVYFINCTLDSWSIQWSGTTATKYLYRQYTCNIHVVDSDGTALQNVIVDCEDTNTDAVWTAGTITTDASGDISEQTISYGYYATGAGSTLQELSPHKFTFSKAGYETLILENITVDGPVDWHLELQPQQIMDHRGNIFHKVGGGSDKHLLKVA